MKTVIWGLLIPFIGVVSFAVGFSLMMALDVALG